MMKILIIPNINKTDALECADSIKTKLIKLGADVKILESKMEYSKTFSKKDLEQISQNDIIISVGGDGTILRAAKAAAVFDKPILGINAGRLGFMSGLEKHELDSLSALTENTYITENRMMLNVALFDANGNRQCSMQALNDAVISRGAQSRIIDLVIELNKNNTINCRADGIIFSTPTGSTAYSFSAGGPVIDPLINCIQLTPICSHSLLSRPMIFSKHSILRAKGAENANADIFLTVDGEEAIKIPRNGYVEIRRSESCAKLIRIKDDCFYDVLKTKFKD